MLLDIELQFTNIVNIVQLDDWIIGEKQNKKRRAFLWWFVAKEPHAHISVCIVAVQIRTSARIVVVWECLAYSWEFVFRCTYSVYW